MNLETGQVVEKYTVERLIGQGGMAAVYLVRHNTLGTRHALKVLTLANPAIAERLVREGRAQASLRHPNAVLVTDVLLVDGNPGLLMEFVDGPDLDQWLTAEKPDVEEAERVFRKVVDAVAEAHAAGLVHRDLKPANVLMAKTAQGWTPKVADFGLAKAVAEGEAQGLHRTRAGVPMGTPAYMAPEQIRDAATVDLRADIFSLGCILYEMVTGNRAFEGNDILAIFNKVANADYAPADSVVPGLPKRILAAIDGCLRADPDQRWASCEALLAVLDGEDPHTVASAPPRRRAPPVLAPDPPASQAPRSGPSKPEKANTNSSLYQTMAPAGRVALMATLPVAGIVAGAFLVIGVGGLFAWWSAQKPATDAVLPPPVPTEVAPAPVPAPAPAPVAPVDPTVAPVPGEVLPVPAPVPGAPAPAQGGKVSSPKNGSPVPAPAPAPVASPSPSPQPSRGSGGPWGAITSSAACDNVGSGKLIGWVYQSSSSLLSGGKKAGADWSIPDAREVRPLKDGKFGNAVCTLPAGTVIHVQDDAQKIDKAYYVPVNGKKYSLP